MLNLKVKKRTNKEIEFGEILGNIYGNKKKNISVKFDYLDFEKIYKQAGNSSIITLMIDKEKYEVIIKEIQIDPVKDRFRHVDFYIITKGELVEAVVPLKIYQWSSYWKTRVYFK